MSQRVLTISEPQIFIFLYKLQKKSFKKKFPEVSAFSEDDSIMIRGSKRELLQKAEEWIEEQLTDLVVKYIDYKGTGLTEEEEIVTFRDEIDVDLLPKRIVLSFLSKIRERDFGLVANHIDKAIRNKTYLIIIDKGRYKDILKIVKRLQEQVREKSEDSSSQSSEDDPNYQLVLGFQDQEITKLYLLDLIKNSDGVRFVNIEGQLGLHGWRSRCEALKKVLQDNLSSLKFKIVQMNEEDCEYLANYMQTGKGKKSKYKVFTKKQVRNAVRDLDDDYGLTGPNKVCKRISDQFQHYLFVGFSGDEDAMFDFIEKLLGQRNLEEIPSPKLKQKLSGTKTRRGKQQELQEEESNSIKTENIKNKRNSGKPNLDKRLSQSSTNLSASQTTRNKKGRSEQTSFNSSGPSDERIREEKRKVKQQERMEQQRRRKQAQDREAQRLRKQEEANKALTLKLMEEQRVRQVELARQERIRIERQKEKREKSRVELTSVTLDNEVEPLNEKDMYEFFRKGSVVQRKDVRITENDLETRVVLLGYPDLTKQQKDKLCNYFQKYFRFQRFIFYKHDEFKQYAAEFIKTKSNQFGKNRFKVVSGYTKHTYFQIVSNESIRKQIYQLIRTNKLTVENPQNPHYFEAVRFVGVRLIGGQLETEFNAGISEIQKRKQNTWVIKYPPELSDIITQNKDIQEHIKATLTQFLKQQLKDLPAALEKLEVGKHSTIASISSLARKNNSSASDLLQIRQEAEYYLIRNCFVHKLDYDVSIESLKQLDPDWQTDGTIYTKSDFDDVYLFSTANLNSKIAKLIKMIEGTKETVQIKVEPYLYKQGKLEIDRMKVVADALQIKVVPPKQNNSQENAIIQVSGFSAQVATNKTNIEKKLEQIDNKHCIHQELMVLRVEEYRILDEDKSTFSRFQEKFGIKLQFDTQDHHSAIEFPNGYSVQFFKGLMGSYKPLKSTSIHTTFIFGDRSDVLDSDKFKSQAGLVKLVSGQTPYQTYQDRVGESWMYYYLNDYQYSLEKKLQLVENNLQRGLSNHIVMCLNLSIGIRKELERLLAYAQGKPKQQTAVHICARDKTQQLQMDSFFRDMQTERTLVFTTKPNTETKWFFTENSQEIPYGYKVDKILNSAVAGGQGKVIITDQDLAPLPSTTHTVNLQNLTMKHVRATAAFPITKSQKGYAFAVGNYTRTLTDAYMNSQPTNSATGDKQLRLAMYEIDLKKMTQFNLFTKFERSIVQHQDKAEKTVKLDLSKAEFKTASRKTKLRLHTYMQSSAERIRQLKEAIERQLAAHRKENLKLQVTASLVDQQIVREYCQENCIKLINIFPLPNDKTQVEYHVQGYTRKDLNQLELKIEAMQKQAGYVVADPDTWTKTDKDIQIFEVTAGSPQFLKVQASFKIQVIKKLSRVQNKYLWKKYCLQKQDLQERSGAPIKEKFLFHGTRDNNPESIYMDKEESFNINYSSDSNYFGRGIYFANEASYSHSYAYKKGILLGLSTRTMLYCRVQVGESQEHQTHDASTRAFKDTSVRDHAKMIKYESVHCFYDGSDIYIVYKSRRAYPEYIIEY